MLDMVRNPWQQISRMGAALCLIISHCISSTTGTREHSSLLDLGDPSNSSKSFMYAQEGDLNIGAVFSIHVAGEQTPCGSQLRESGVVQYVEAVAFAINQINESPELLPDFQLGFVILDDCMNPQTALAQTLHFFPIKDRPNGHCYERCRSTSASHQFYDVVGVIGAENSPASMVMANALGIFQVPQISPSSTSDLLSDKTKYPYFMRMMPPDRFQVRAILDLLLHFSWTYVAMVYSSGGYGEEAVRRLKEVAGNHSICIGATIAISEHAEENDYNKILSDLYAHRAKIVVLFIDQEEAREIFRATKRKGLIGRFVWVGSDGIGFNTDDFDGIEEAAVGTLTLRPYSPRVRDFEEYFESLSPAKNPNNPWLRPMWEELFQCKLDRSCQGRRIKDAPDYHPEAIVANIIDSVYTYAHALHRLIQDKPHICRRIKGKINPDCVSGSELIAYLKNVSFTGITGNISFDANGDIQGRYEVVNFQKFNKDASVGIWEMSRRELTINDSLIIWPAHSVFDNQTIPASSGCGKTCDKGQIYSYLKNTCCWNCRSCAPNQITAEGATRCIDCLKFYWPNSNFSECVKISAMYASWGDPVVLVTAALSLFGLVLTLLITMVFIKNNDARIIKATSRELTYIMLTGVFIQYFLVFTFISKPRAVVCVFNYIGFNVSFSVVYAALLTRTNRIFRIFNAGKKTKMLPSLTSPISQILIAIILIGIQVSDIFSPFRFHKITSKTRDNNRSTNLFRH